MHPPIYLEQAQDFYAKVTTSVQALRNDELGVLKEEKVVLKMKHSEEW
jgi:hypothetical protein